MNKFPLLAGICAILAVQCTSQKVLTDEEKAKLDPPLIRLLTGEDTGRDKLDFNLKSDGTKEYSVIVRTKNPKDLTNIGITPSSIFGDVVVAHVTIEELRKIISLSSVRAVETGSRNIIQQNK